MKHAKQLPQYLAKRYHGWKVTDYEDNKEWYRHLAAEGQSPRAMVISCCDSRVHVTSIFGADQGEFFIHRNIANLVPPYEPDGKHHGTSAAIEFAVTSLKVAHLIVLGHSNCGGANGCYDMCKGKAPALENKNSFVGRWIEILRPGFERVSKMKIAKEADERRQLEKETVVVSLSNLMTFPFVKEAVTNETMSLHGLWTDTGEGGLLQYDAESDTFIDV
jgi:carbonic anhydrase